MNEIKQPKKQLITYIILVAVVMILLNSMIMPSLKQAQITETDYNTFITMTENDQIKEVEITSSQILFTIWQTACTSTMSSSAVISCSLCLRSCPF